MAIQRTTKQQILDAINDLHGAEQLVTREALQEVTGLKLTIIDDRVATLVDEGAVIRKGRGVFVPAIQHPPARPISKTVMPDGMIKIEIGDMVLTLTYSEHQTLATLQAGISIQHQQHDQCSPARPISKTVMPDGMIKIEIGDEMLTLTPREDRLLSKVVSGALVECAVIEIGQEMSNMVSVMRARIDRLEDALRPKYRGDPQMELDGVKKSPDYPGTT